MAAYTPLTWVDEVPNETPPHYVISGANSDCTIALKTTPPTAGTPVNATNLNHIEQGIVNALIVNNRQGGSATDWSSAGTSNYTPASAKIQVGVIEVVTGGYANLTFPSAFSAHPIVFTTSQAWNKFASYANVSNNNCRVYLTLYDGSATTGYVSWLAIGPG